MNIKFYFICLFLSINADEIYGQGNSGEHPAKSSEQLSLLKHLIGESERFDREKLARIEKLYENFPKTNSDHLFESYSRLYQEYALFRSDSAFEYANKLQVVARNLDDSSLLSHARMKISFILLSSGMPHEAHDSLITINPHHLSKEQMAEYHTLMARYYYDMADYTQNESYRLFYNNNGGLYLDSALMLYPVNSFEYNYYSGLRNLRFLDFDKASLFFKILIKDPKLSDHQLALTASTLGDIYIRNEQRDTAISMLITAASADLRSSTKETSALFSLATLLFQQGDLTNASLFIEKAAEDASFYGSRQRKAQLSVILPLIKEEKLRALVGEKKNLFTYAMIVTLSFVALGALTGIIIRQVKKLQVQQKEISGKNESLRHLVEEKEWLLKEIHHRVKNNLQTVVSLLESQSHYLEKDALMAVQNSQHRVYAMSLIHQKLYSPENPTTIKMSAYLPELVNYLSDSFNIKQRIKFSLHINEIELDVSQAIPLGLILNEAITNAIKYAFSSRDDNQIAISMKFVEKDRIELVISDNGRGLPDSFQSNKNETLGLKLIKGLTEDINGSLSIKSMEGTHITVSFSPSAILKSNDISPTKMSKVG